MDRASSQWELLKLLAKRYENDCSCFVLIPQGLTEASLVRSAIAELKRDKHIEERVRGVIRLNPHGYLIYQKELLGLAAAQANRHPAQVTIRHCDNFRHVS
jgi:hypothetical protein